MQARYSAIAFDPDRKISPSDIEQIKSLLRMSPSSTNIQPWHYVIASTEAGKARIAKGTQGFFLFNASKVKTASPMVLFCTKVTAEDA